MTGKRHWSGRCFSVFQDSFLWLIVSSPEQAVPVPSKVPLKSGVFATQAVAVARQISTSVRFNAFSLFRAAKNSSASSHLPGYP